MSLKSKLSYLANPERVDISRNNIRYAGTPEARRKAINNRRSYEKSGNPFWQKQHTNQSKQKIRNSNYHKTLTGTNNPNYGKSWNDEQRQRASLHNKQRDFYIGKIYNVKYINLDGTEEQHKIYNLQKYCTVKQLSYKNVSYLLPKKGKYLNLIFIDKTSAKLNKAYSDIVYEVYNSNDSINSKRIS
jgi:hypothetical protein